MRVERRPRDVMIIVPYYNGISSVDLFAICTVPNGSDSRSKKVGRHAKLLTNDTMQSSLL
jgi:hypothetical protein